MKLDFIDLGKLSISKTNMRYAKKAPDVADILPTVRARGVLVPLIVRPNCAEGAFEIVAGARRFTAATIVAGEKGVVNRECGAARSARRMPCSTSIRHSFPAASAALLPRISNAADASFGLAITIETPRQNFPGRDRPSETAAELVRSLQRRSRRISQARLHRRRRRLSGRMQ